MRISYWCSDVCSSDLARRGRDAGSSILARAFRPQVRSPARPRQFSANRAPAPTRAAPAYQRPADPSLRLSGSITALATPFTAAGELDLDAWRDLLQAQRLAGTQAVVVAGSTGRSEEHTSELQSLMRISYAVFCLKKKKIK